MIPAEEQKISSFEADSVVLACGMKSKNDLKEQAEEAGFRKPIFIRDWAEFRRIQYAMAEAFQAAFTV
jgi:hypothetical protein